MLTNPARQRHPLGYASAGILLFAVCELCGTAAHRFGRDTTHPAATGSRLVLS